MIWIVMLAIAMMPLSGCKVKKCLQPERVVETVTRTEYKEVVRDSIVRVPADTSSMEAWFECDSMNRVYLKQINQMQGQRSSIATNTKTVGKAMVITADCVCDSLAIYLTIKDRYVTKERTKDEKQVITVPEKVKVWPWFVAGLIVNCVLQLAYRIFLKSKIIRLWQKLKQMLRSGSTPM